MENKSQHFKRFLSENLNQDEISMMTYSAGTITSNLPNKVQPRNSQIYYYYSPTYYYYLLLLLCMFLMQQLRVFHSANRLCFCKNCSKHKTLVTSRQMFFSPLQLLYVHILLQILSNLSLYGHIQHPDI